DAEIEFLLRERVELNALTSEELVEMVERKLRAHGLQKVVPDKEILAETYRSFHRSNELRERFEEIEAEFDEEADEVTVPKNLAKRVREVLRKHPDLRWDDAVQHVLGDTLDDIRERKREDKERSGDFSADDDDEDGDDE
ncbi:MAG TPA: hypothetical protein VKE42_04870, partial [Candidatus Cybelea sp.]|nr:hypothetical protein [Candidatus Cybelea sp.]